jgi:hypothetical protein
MAPDIIENCCKACLLGGEGIANGGVGARRLASRLSNDVCGKGIEE